MGVAIINKDFTPKDGGFQAWLVVTASTVICGLLFGVINAFSVIYVEILRIFEDAGIEDASSKASLVGSLTIGMVYLLAPVAGILTDRLGLRMTSVIGGILATLGLLGSSWLTQSVPGLYLTYAIMFGSGTALCCTPSLAILGYYFRRKLGLVNGIVTCGGSVFAMIVPPVVESLILRIGLPGVLRVFALVMSINIIASLAFKVPEECKKNKIEKSNNFKWSSLINMDNWRNKKYIIWSLALPITYFGYFVPFVHIVKFVNVNFPEQDGKIIIMSLAISTGVSRMIFGIVSDLPRVNRILLQQAAFICSGLLIMTLPAVTGWGWLVTVVVGIGMFDGGLICLIGAIAFDICGVEGGAQAIGFIYGVCSLPLTVGPPIAGLIFDRTNSYTLPFILAGCSPILSALVLFAMRCVKDEKVLEKVDTEMQCVSNGFEQNKESNKLTD